MHIKGDNSVPVVVASTSFLCCIPGVSNKQMEKAAMEFDSDMKLPKRKDWVVVIVTAVMSPTRFYIHLPLGCMSPLSLHLADGHLQECVYM